MSSKRVIAIQPPNEWLSKDGCQFPSGQTAGPESKPPDGRGFGGVPQPTPRGWAGGKQDARDTAGGSGSCLTLDSHFPLPISHSSSDQLAADGGKCDREHRKRQEEP